MQVECPNFARSRSGVERIYKDLRSAVNACGAERNRFGKGRPSFESWNAAALKKSDFVASLAYRFRLSFLKCCAADCRLFQQARWPMVVAPNVAAYRTAAEPSCGVPWRKGFIWRRANEVNDCEGRFGSVATRQVLEEQPFRPNRQRAQDRQAKYELVQSVAY